MKKAELLEHYLHQQKKVYEMEKRMKELSEDIDEYPLEESAYDKGFLTGMKRAYNILKGNT